MDRLQSYLAQNGILLCNANPSLPALEDIGCTWHDVTETIDAHGLFYCKAFQKRTAYLSPGAYYLLKRIKAAGAPKPLPPDAATLCQLLQDGPPAETTELKRLSGMEGKRYAAAFDFLLRNLQATALHNGTVLNPHWSTFLYGTAAAWERHTPDPFAADALTPAQAKECLWALVGRAMGEKAFRSFAR